MGLDDVSVDVIVRVSRVRSYVKDACGSIFLAVCCVVFCSYSFVNKNVWDTWSLTQ